MKKRTLYPIASPWLIPDEGDAEMTRLVELCDGRRPLDRITGRTRAGQRRAAERIRMGERLGVIALAEEELPFLNAFYGEEGGALLFEGAKIRGISPTSWLSTIKRHYKELSGYLNRPPEEIHQLFQTSFGPEAPGNVPGRAPKLRPERIIRAVWSRYESDAYLARRHLIHFYGLAMELLFSRSIRQIGERFRAGSKLILLDAGCGNGEWMRRVRAMLGSRCRTVGIDIGWNILRFSRWVDRHRGSVSGNTLRSNAEKLPFLRETFDAICCFEVMEHLLSPDTALREFYRILRPGGLLALSWSSGENLMSGHVSAAGPDEAIKALRKARFRVDYVEEVPEAQTTYLEVGKLPGREKNNKRD